MKIVKSMKAKFLQDFILSSSLILQLAGSDLVQTMLNPVRWVYRFLQVRKRNLVVYSRFHTPITQYTFSELPRGEGTRM